MAEPAGGYSAAYRKRIERRLGMTIEAARDRGLSFQKARGHRRREHLTREQNRLARGDLTELQRAFLRRQSKRTQNPEVWEIADLMFRRWPHAKREEYRIEQGRLARGYAHKVGGRRRGSNPMRSGTAGFVPDELDMGLNLPDFDFGSELPLLFYH